MDEISLSVLRPRPTRLRRVAALIVAAATVAGLATVGPVHPVAAAGIAGVDRACPSAFVPSAGFHDTANDSHATSIDCLAWWDITQGAAGGGYGPARPIPREQLATMLARVLRTTGHLPTDVPPVAFDDVVPGVHSTNVAVLAHLGVVNGNGTGFNPGGSVSRGAMASMLVRLLEKVYGHQLPEGPDFPDTADDAHHANIRKLAGSGITTGTSDGRYLPGVPVTRAQMATFVMRSVDLLVADGQATVPEALRGSPAAYSFMAQQAVSNLPVRWDPCAPIPYVVNVSEGGPTALADVHEAVKRVSVATGMTFEYLGLTSAFPMDDWGLTRTPEHPSGYAPLIIGWAHPHQTDMFGADPTGIAGMAGPIMSGTADDWWHVSGRVAINADAAPFLATGFGPNSIGKVLVHELGHAIGLGHVLEYEQLMSQGPKAFAATWGAGDRAGLRRVGRPAGCRPATAADSLDASSEPGGRLVAPPMLDDRLVAPPMLDDRGLVTLPVVRHAVSR